MNIEAIWNATIWLWPVAVGLLDLALAVWATVHIVLNKRDSRAAISWTGLVWLAPIVGAFAYFLLGINRIQRKALALQIQKSWRDYRPPDLTAEERAQLNRFAEENPNLVGLAILGHGLTSRPVLPGNRVEPLVNGDRSYPAMLAAIDRAERSVTMQSYIFDADAIGQQFLEALLRAQGRGVQVRILIDHIGSRYSRPNMVQQLLGAGLNAVAFLPTLVPRLFRYANLRNHRKILVVDGRVGFTGGTNIREGHCLNRQPPHPVQCLHFFVEGPVVAHLQEAFAIDWAFASGEQLRGDTWFPVLERTGSVWARGISDGPDEDFEKLSELIQGALATASRSVRIVTPYFLPDAALLSALKVCALRGIDVRLYLPAKNNISLVQWAAWTSFEYLLGKGCRIFYTPAPFDHTKLMVVDDVWALVGSTNWDQRSLRLNFEFNVECYDVELARRLGEIIADKESRCREITLDDVRKTSLPARLRNGLARLLTPYL
jgi:cardiolipin synthase